MTGSARSLTIPLQSVLFTHSFSDRAKKIDHCIYVKEESDYDELEDLRGKRLAGMIDVDSYALIREIAGEAPESFFKIQITGDFSASVYALAFDEADAAILTTTSFRYFELTNPGPVKNIRRLACGESFSPVPVLRSKDMPQDTTDKIRELMLQAPEKEYMKKYRPLLKMTKLKYIPVAPGAYDNIFKIFRKADKNGWFEDCLKFKAGKDDD